MSDTINKDMQELRRQTIEIHYGIIRAAQATIDQIAKEAIPEFHFLDHKVSNFWGHCKNSPIGYCVWDISKDQNMRNVACYYCGEPTERK